MTLRLRVLVGIAVMSLVAIASAQPPPGPSAPSVNDLDKIAVEILKDVHNRGAVLNNNGNPDACYYLYEGGLRTVKPFLAHHPAVQTIIDNGLDEVAQAEGNKVKAFRLHEIIEEVRAALKVEIKKAAEAPKPEPKPMSPEPEPKPNPVEVLPEPKPKKPTPPVVAPMPEPKPKKPEPIANEGQVQGMLTLNGQPLGRATLTVVTTDKPLPRVHSVQVNADGSYQFEKPLPPGEYAVMVTHDSDPVPERYKTTLTSGIRFSVRAGANTLDLKLMSK